MKRLRDPHREGLRAVDLDLAEMQFRTKVARALVNNLAFRRWLIAVLLQTGEEPPPPHSPYLRVLDGGLDE